MSTVGRVGRRIGQVGRLARATQRPAPGLWRRAGTPGERLCTLAIENPRQRVVDLRLKVELLPGVPPGIGAGHDRALVDALDTVAVAEPIGLARVLELRLDL